MGNDSQEAETQPNIEVSTSAEGCHAERCGDLGEMTFVLKAASLGITPSKPYGDRHPYDFLVQHGQRLLRIQVKSVFTTRPGQRFGFPVAVSKHRRQKRTAYRSDEIGFFAVFVAPRDAWYLIPVDVLSGRKFINLYPGGQKRRDAGRFEHYREAWHLLKGT